MLKVVLFSFVIYGAFVAPVFSQNNESNESNEPPLVDEDTSTIASALDNLIQDRINNQKMAGVAVALIHDATVSWINTYGVENTLTRKTVTAKTAFPVASLGKVVTALIILQLVDKGELSLDEPISTELKSSTRFDIKLLEQITIRQLLSHSSGLGNNLMDENPSLIIEPGKRFIYSGVGYELLQEMLEHKYQKPIDELADDWIYQPLNLQHSFFDSSKYPNHSIAFEHLAAGEILKFILIIMLPLFLLLCWTRNVMKDSKWMNLISIIVWIVPYLFTALLLSLFVPGGLVPSLWISLYGILFIVVLWILVLLVIHIIKRFSHPSYCNKWSKPFIFLVLTGFLLYCVNSFLIPLPNFHKEGGSSASTFHASIYDYAEIINTIISKDRLSDNAVELMNSQQIPVNEHISWGLGIGIQHSSNGDSLWQWGSNMGANSMIVCYPTEKIGVIVFSNSGNSMDLVREVVSTVLGGKTYWRHYPVTMDVTQ